MPVPQLNVALPDCQENWEFISSRIFDTGDIKTSIKNADHSGWLLCNARAVTGGSLKTLLLQLGSPFGVSGSDPLLPEGREKILVGAGATHALGASFGQAAPTVPAGTTGNDNADHTHTYNVITVATVDGGSTVNVTGLLFGNTTSGRSTVHQHAITAVGNATDGNYPPSIAVNYFIHT